MLSGTYLGHHDRGGLQNYAINIDQYGPMNCGGYTNSLITGPTTFPTHVVSGSSAMYVAGDSYIVKISLNTRMVMMSVPVPDKVKVMSVGKHLFCGTESGVKKKK